MPYSNLLHISFNSFSFVVFLLLYMDWRDWFIIPKPFCLSLVFLLTALPFPGDCILHDGADLVPLSGADRNSRRYAIANVPNSIMYPPLFQVSSPLCRLDYPGFASPIPRSVFNTIVLLPTAGCSFQKRTLVYWLLCCVFASKLCCSCASPPAPGLPNRLGFDSRSASLIHYWTCISYPLLTHSINSNWSEN